jgi:hypothetical protein
MTLLQGRIGGHGNDIINLTGWISAISVFIFSSVTEKSTRGTQRQCNGAPLKYLCGRKKKFRFKTWGEGVAKEINQRRLELEPTRERNKPDQTDGPAKYLEK